MAAKAITSADSPLTCPELLAPAGDRLCITAAVENGADSVYFGLDCGFNARARATNLHLDDLPEIMHDLRIRGIRGYVTLNTLVFPDELKSIERTVIALTEAGTDAVLVQDLGLVRLIRTLSPDLPIHASTQMTLTSAECIEAAADLGIERVVLARELSIKEIRAIREQTDVELEAFVHGALCVAYSGQCLTSESLGGRSANRGQCAQACRLPYDLVSDGREIDLGDVKYLLSPQDLAAHALVPDLISAGVNCFKIEGRLKTPEYVANITRHYRRAIDAAVTGKSSPLSQQDVIDMEMSFSRGFSVGWLGGCDHKMLVPGQSSAKRGVFLGRVTHVGRRSVVIIRQREPISIEPGDGVAFDGDRQLGEAQGGRVYEVRRQGSKLELFFGRGAIDFGRLSANQQVWKTDDPQLTSRLRKSFQGKSRRHVWLDLEIEVSPGVPLRVTGRTKSGAACCVATEELVQVARKHPLTDEILREKFGRLGGTAYQLRNLTARLSGTPMVPLSVLGKARREMIQQLNRSTLEQPPRRTLSLAESPLNDDLPNPDDKNESQAQLVVLCRTLEQLEAAVGCGITNLIADFQDIRQYREAAQAASCSQSDILLATPRIQKPGEWGIFVAMARHGATGFLVRNLAGVSFCRENEIPYVCDFSLNAANRHTVAYLRSLGARRVTASYDLNREQLLDLASTVPTFWLEVVIHQHMPMFHMEHCVFCAVLSPGTNKTNCGRPCDVHEVKLRDRVGMEHVLHADVGCRNTLYNAMPQSSAEVTPTLVERGLRYFRIELLSESPSELSELVGLYRDLIAGEVSGRHVWQQLNAVNRVGVTRGTLEERRNPLAIL